MITQLKVIAEEQGPPKSDKVGLSFPHRKTGNKSSLLSETGWASKYTNKPTAFSDNMVNFPPG